MPATEGVGLFVRRGIRRGSAPGAWCARCPGGRGARGQGSGVPAWDPRSWSAAPESNHGGPSERRSAPDSREKHRQRDGIRKGMAIVETRFGRAPRTGEVGDSRREDARRFRWVARGNGGARGRPCRRTEKKPRGGEAPGLRERGRRSGQRNLSRQVVLSQFIVQVTKLPTFAVPKVPLVAVLGAPVRSSSPSASQVQVKDTSIVWVHSLVS